MKVIAGIGLDGRKPNQIKPLLNTLVVGEAGLLAELEMRAGIPVKNQPRAERIVRYLDAMKQADNGDRFYSKSLQTDPIASAEKVLWWRDWVFDHGWQPTTKNTGRLSDLAAIEKSTHSLSPSTGERIQAIEQELQQITFAIKTVELIQPPTDWPPIYQQLFTALATAGIKVEVTQADLKPMAHATTDLGRLQAAIASGATKPIGVKGDGTLLVYQAESASTAASFLNRSLNKKHLMIASKKQFALNAGAVYSGQPDPGLGERSHWRAPNQLLPLILQCAWSPPKAETLLQYLSLPTGTYLSLRRHLARLYSDQPGYDPKLWETQIERYIKQLLKRNPDNNPDKLRTTIHAWLPIGRADSDSVMEKSLAFEIADMVSHYWRSKVQATSEAPDSTIYAAFQAADALCNALNNWPETHIDRDQLNRLLDLASDAGSASFRHTRLVSDFNAVETAEAASFYQQQPEQIIWWDCSITASVPIPPFTRQELAAIPLAESEQTAAKRRQSTLSRHLELLLQSQKQLVLIAVNDTPDLLKLTISQLLDIDTWTPLEQNILDNNLPQVICHKVKDVSLPKAERWLNMGSGINTSRPKHSYSSLQSLALKPHEYVFKYTAQLHEGALTALPFDARLKGNLSHRVIECWFEENPWSGKAPSVKVLRSWLDKTFGQVVQACALPLLDAGMRAERMAFRETLEHAMQRLFEQLEQAAIRSVQVEQQSERKIPNGILEGTIDLLCETDDGRWAIIDMKWGSLIKYRDELKQGRHLQLATYAHLLKAKPGTKIADVAYFILSKAILLSTSTVPFSAATLVIQDSGVPNLQTIWDSFANTCQWRSKQLNVGQVEVTYGPQAPDQTSQPPANCIPVCDAEGAAHTANNQHSFRKPNFKPVDPWRVITGEIKE